MFASLSERLQRVIKNLSGQGKLSESNIQDTLKEIQKALIEADVAVEVIQRFIDNVKTRVLGQEVSLNLSPGQMITKIVHEELTLCLGDDESEVRLTGSPAIILFAGLQGSGKTTSAAKLARWLRENKNIKKILVASTDVYRPAAMQQLKTLADQVQVDYFEAEPTTAPLSIANAAADQARRQFYDVLIVDTAGRLHIDTEMMQELKSIHTALKPSETFFVIDSMAGQDAVNTARAFHNEVDLTGVILTKTDGDARGGVALSVKFITGKPIKFMGTGEKSDAFQVFHAERIASRILGMGDVLTLIEDLERNVDQQKAQKLAQKIQKGKSFDLEDLRDQILEMNKMGGVMSLLEKLPGMGQMQQMAQKAMPEKEMKRTLAVINSMTIKERRHPQILRGSRKRRIAEGSGTTIEAVNRVIKQFEQMQKMMKRFSNPAQMMQMMKMMQQKGGGF